MKRFLTFALALLMLLSFLPSVTADSPHTHNWKEKSRVESTCTKDGYAVYTCSCGARKTETLPALGHEFSKQVYTSYADCTHYGVFYWVCERCGAHSPTGNDKPLGHDWGEGVLTKAPTETEEGEITYTCWRDPSHTKTEAVPATGPIDPSLKLSLSAEYKFGYTWETFEYYLGVKLNETLTNTGDVPLRVITSNVKDYIGDAMKVGFFSNILQPGEQISFSSFHYLQGIWFDWPDGSGHEPGDITFDTITYTPDDPKYIGYAVLDVYHYGWPTQGENVDSSKVKPLCLSNTETITVRLPRDGYVEEFFGLGIMKTEAHGPANGEYYELGETIDYVITITNDSGSDLKDLAVYDSLAGFEPIATAESFAQGETLKFEYSTVVTQDELDKAYAINSAVVTFTYGDGASATPRFSNWVYSKAGNPDAPETAHFDKAKLNTVPEFSSDAETAEQWNAEAEKLYELLWEAGDDEAKCAVLEERAMFRAYLQAINDGLSDDVAAFRLFRAQMLYGRLAELAESGETERFDAPEGLTGAELIAEELRLKCLSLYALINDIK